MLSKPAGKMPVRAVWAVSDTPSSPLSEDDAIVTGEGESRRNMDYRLLIEPSKLGTRVTRNIMDELHLRVKNF